MNDSLASTLVLCDLDNLLLGEDGNLTQVVRDVLQLFSSRGGRLTVFSQRSPRAVRSILGSVRLAAPALVCGGTMAYHYADGNRVPLCSFAQQQELFACLPDTPGVGVAVQMQDGTTRVLRMSNALERHLRQEWTPYLLANAADIHPEQVLRVLLYQDSKSVPLISLAEKAIGDRVALLGERIAPDTLVLTPKRISGREMLDTVCTMAQVGAEQVLVLAVHVDEPLAQFLEQGQRRRGVVDESPALARCGQLAPHYAVVGVVLYVVLAEKLLHVVAREVEMGLDDTLRRPCLDGLGVGPLTEQQTNGTEYDALSGARLARNDREAGVEPYVERVDEGEVLYD